MGMKVENKVKQNDFCNEIEDMMYQDLTKNSQVSYKN